MGTYVGTDNDDSIDGNSLPDETSKIDPKAGDDTLFNLNSVEVIAGPGNDNISGTDVRYALWRSPSSPTVNLNEGFALDGFGFRDDDVLKHIIETFTFYPFKNIGNQNIGNFWRVKI